MLENKCSSCTYDAVKLGFKGFLYKFFRVIKKDSNKNIINIYYNNNDHGCRMSKWNEKESICLTSNFSQYKEFNI